MTCPSQPFSIAYFLAWEARQERKHEFVDGGAHPLPGQPKGHNRIVGAMLVALHQRLRGAPCQVYGSDMKFESPLGNVRYPDLQVDCGPFRGEDLISAEPRVIVEVLLPSNDFFDVAKRLRDYQAHPSVREIVLISSLRPEAQLWVREGEGWGRVDFEGQSGALPLASLGLEIPFAEIFDGAGFGESEN